MRVGDRVVLKDSSASPITIHGQDGEPPKGILTVRTLTVVETRTKVNVLWQDGTCESLNARETIP